MAKKKKRERSLLYSKLAAKLRRQFDCPYFYYKIPDTFGLGGKRPFDSVLVVGVVAFAIELKSEGDKLEKYQSICLNDFDKAGGVPMVFTDGECMDTFIGWIKEKIAERR